MLYSPSDNDKVVAALETCKKEAPPVTGRSVTAAQGSCTGAAGRRKPRQYGLLFAGCAVVAGVLARLSGPFVLWSSVESAGFAVIAAMAATQAPTGKLSRHVALSSLHGACGLAVGGTLATGSGHRLARAVLGALVLAIPTGVLRACIRDAFFDGADVTWAAVVGFLAGLADWTLSATIDT